MDVGKSLDTNLNKDHAMMKTRWPTRDLNETSGPTKQNWLKWSICGEHLKSVAQVNEPLEAARARSIVIKKNQSKRTSGEKSGFEHASGPLARRIFWRFRFGHLFI